jgi:hypothetical protein
VAKTTVTIKNIEAKPMVERRVPTIFMGMLPIWIQRDNRRSSGAHVLMDAETILYGHDLDSGE